MRYHSYFRYQNSHSDQCLVPFLYLVCILIVRSCGKHCRRVLNTQLCRAVYRIGLLNGNTHDLCLYGLWCFEKLPTVLSPQPDTNTNGSVKEGQNVGLEDG